MKRIMLLLPILLLLMSPIASSGQPTDGQAKMTNAMSAAPASVSDHATIKDWDGTVLREGTNNWTCYPDMPDAPNNTPMCLDETWIEWLDAWQNKGTPTFTSVGIGYMLQGGPPGSNTDPFAEGPAADNEWMEGGPPHVMVILPDVGLYDGLPTDPENGGPWVMHRGTSFAHIMIPAPKVER
jgi:hypothetical protein